MNEESARIINVSKFAKKDTGEMFARVTYTLKMQDSEKFSGSAVLSSYIPVDKFDCIKPYVDKVVNIKISNRPGKNNQLVAHLVKIGNEEL